MPVSMAIAPDGRIFVSEQTGKLRVIKNGKTLSTPFLTLDVDSTGERGLLGIVFDPDFVNNRYLYLMYTAKTPNVHNRVSRFTASATNPDVVAAGSEVVVIDLDPLVTQFHNGGALHFGPDGKLYLSVGDNNQSGNAQVLTNVFGKILRINKDGTIPTDNPFFAQTTGNNRAIWAMGLRNPFTFAFQPGTGRMHVNDVGSHTWEEINLGTPGANWGWPTTEGPTSDPRFRAPVFAYGHVNGFCAVTGGTFYNPTTPNFPSSYVGKYFFGDYCSGQLRVFDPATNTVTPFATEAGVIQDIRVGPDGALYYLIRAGMVQKISFNGSGAPAISQQPSNATVSVGQNATFTVGATGNAPLAYQWQRNGTNIMGATSPSYTVMSVQASDSGARFRAVVTNGQGSATSMEAVLTVTANQPPTGTITSPAADSLYRAGDTISFSGTGTDPEDGTLPASAFTWRVDFHHDTHNHPFFPATSGMTSGSVTIPNRGETATNVWYRFYLTVTDSGGLMRTTWVDVQPVVANVTLATTPAGFQLKLDGQPVATPFTFSSVAGIIRSIEAVTPQTSGGKSWSFVSWSDGGAALHEITSPQTNTTFTATFQEVAPPSGGLYEAENARLAGPTVASNQPGFTGTGFADYVNYNEYVEWTVNVATAGSYDLELRYALGTTTMRTQQIQVNGAVVNSGLAFPVTGGWGTWATVRQTATLNAGNNLVRATSIGTNGPNIDHLRVIPR